MSVVLWLCLALTSRAKADCFTAAGDPNKTIDLALFVAGLNHLLYPDGTEAPAWKSVDEPIRFLRDEIKARYPDQRRLIVAITGNKQTDLFPGGKNHPADRLEQLLVEGGVQVGGSVGEDQFRVIYGPDWTVLKTEFIKYPNELAKDGFNGFLYVDLRPMHGEGWDTVTPDLDLFVFRGHVSNDDIRTRQYEFIANYVKKKPTNHRVALPILAADTNTRFPTHDDANLLAQTFQWLTFRMPCNGGSPAIFGGGESDLMNILMLKGDPNHIAFKPAFIGYQVAINNKPSHEFEGISVRQLAHNVAAIFFQRTKDAKWCADGLNACDDGSCRKTCPDANEPPHCPAANPVFCECSGTCVKSHKMCQKACGDALRAFELKPPK